MNRIAAVGASLLIASTSMMAGTGFGTGSGAKNFKLNNAVGQNTISFLSDAPAEKIKGTADKVNGTIKLDANNLESTTGKIEVEVKSMTSAVSKRDEHMYSDAWLNADAFPKITFDVQKLTDVKIDKANGRNTATATAVGTFTMHGVTKTLSAPVTIVYVPESADTKKRSPGDLVTVKAVFNVALKDFNVTGKPGIVGSKVGESIQIEANMFANSI